MSDLVIYLAVGLCFFAAFFVWEHYHMHKIQRGYK